MAIKALRAPHYSPTCGQYIDDTDASLDRERMDEEINQMAAEGMARLAEDPEADITELLPHVSHPLFRYWDGEHRYDLDAIDYFSGKPVKIRDYFNKGEPDVFTLQRLTPEQWNEVSVEFRSGGSISDDASEEVKARQAAKTEAATRRAFLLACRYGVRSCNNFMLGRDGDSLSDAAMQHLHNADHSLALKLGRAVFLGYSKPPTKSELFR